jgi:hypothetical protein
VTPGDNAGYKNGVVSPTLIANTGNDDPGTISVATGTFTFDEGYFTAAFRDNLQLTVDGYGPGNVLLESQTFYINEEGPVDFHPDWSGLTSVVFSATGGAPVAGVPGSGTQIAMDSLTFTTFASAAPEPATWALMLLGVGAVGAALRRKPAHTFAA